MSVGEFHPLKGSEDDRPELTRQQEDVVNDYALEFESVGVRLLPSGDALIECFNHCESGEPFLAAFHTVSRDGIPL